MANECCGGLAVKIETCVLIIMFEYVDFLHRDIFAAQYFVVEIKGTYVNQNRQKHNIYGPACKIPSYKDQPTVRYYIFNNLHREHNPAYIVYYHNGALRTVEYYQHGHIHRYGEPAEINYYIDGQIMIRRWYTNGLLHTNIDRSYEQYDEQGTLIKFIKAVHEFSTINK